MLEMAFNEPNGSLQPEMKREEIGGWDSMGALMLIAELDDRFGIILTPEQSREFSRLADVFELLRSNGVLVEG